HSLPTRRSSDLKHFGICQFEQLDASYTGIKHHHLKIGGLSHILVVPWKFPGHKPIPHYVSVQLNTFAIPHIHHLLLAVWNTSAISSSIRTVLGRMECGMKYSF